ncbi:MAG: DUF938 domain-containing protein, partial [Caulobacteraceae bacterium]
RLPRAGTVLELASGSGEHAAHNAAAFPGLQWRPSDADPQALASIAAWRGHVDLPNLLAPIRIDASAPDEWPIDHADAVVCINMVHISPWEATQGLLKGAARLLPQGGGLFLYGPYLEAGVTTAPSNVEFDLSLKRRNPGWGLRQLEEVSRLAAQHGLDLAERIAMPANNLILVYRKT